jgi:hypothetical protein
MSRRTTAAIAGALGLLAIALVPIARADTPADPNKSPALCSSGDTPETGMQGDVPKADQDSGRADAGYNCGLSLISEVPAFTGGKGPLSGGTTQGSGHCVYIRTPAGDATVIRAYDVSDPAHPTQTAEVPTFTPAHGSTTETMRAVTTDERAILVSGTGVYDIRDCEHPTLIGKINWPGMLPWPAGLSHDVRVSFDGKKAYTGLGVVEADISDLYHPDTWKVTNYTCAVAAQYNPIHAVPAALGVSQCDDTPIQDTAPQLTHGPGINFTGTRLYIGNQSQVSSFYPGEDGSSRILDLTQKPPKILATYPIPGHSIDWFRGADGRDYTLQANEIVMTPQETCLPHPRPHSLGWANEAFLTDVTGDIPTPAAMVELAINKSENCQAKLSSGQNTQIAYHAVDNAEHATFAMISFGSAGLRVIDIRDPKHPVEAAYFNRGQMQHAAVGHWDAARGLLYEPGPSGLQVLELQPQVIAALGLPYPTDPAYPRFPNGRPATPTP